MSYFIAGIFRIMLLEASVALLVFQRVITEPLRRRWRWAMYGVAGVSVIAFVNFGELHGGGRLVHPWEQYHFFLGSKYLRELGYFDIYKATLVVDRERAHQLDDVGVTRDLHDFTLVRVSGALADAERVRAQFSDARWAAFADDWASLSDWSAPWDDVVADHGNSGSPAWALVALPFVTIFGSSHAGQVALAMLDLLLIAGMFVLVFRTFGAGVGATGLVIWCLSPFCFDYLGGSILRWDWLFALGMALCFLKRERPWIAGAFLGYAIVSKVFPIFFVLALGFRFGIESIRRRALHPHLPRLAGGAAASAVGFVLVSSLVFGGFSIWSSYGERIGVAQTEKYYPNQYSLETVYLQIAESTPHSLAHNLIKPAEIKQARADVDISDHEVGFTIVRVLLTAFALFAIARLDPLEAFAAAPFLIFIWITVNAYYWDMLALSAIVLAAHRRLSYALIALHVLWASYYLYQHLAWRFAEGYFVSLMMIASFVTWVVHALVSRRDSPTTSA